MLVLVILVLLDVHGKEMCQCIYARLSNTFNDNKSKFLTPYQFDYTVEVEYQKWFFESQNTQYDPVAYLGGGALGDAPPFGRTIIFFGTA